MQLNLVIECPKFILGVSRVKGSIWFPCHQYATAQHFSLTVSDPQEEAGVSQEADKKNILVLNISHLGTMCTGVAINGALGNTTSLRKMKCGRKARDANFLLSISSIRLSSLL